jgi:hypothetical protein
MSFIYSQALVEAFSLGSCLDIEQSAPSSGSLTLKPCLWHDRTMEPSRLSRFGMTCKPLTESHGAELLTSWLEGFRAKTLALQETARDLTENAAECGTTWPASLAKFDPDTSSWKTAQLSLLGGLEEFSETWPRWGLMRAGECWERQTLVPLTSGSESGLSLSIWPTPNCDGFRSDGELAILARTLTDYGQFLGMTEKAAMGKRDRAWPTPTVCGNYNRKGASATSGDGLATAVTQRTYPTATATATAYKGWSPNHNRAGTDDRLDYTVEREAFNPGQQTPPMRLNPEWVEWLMGWPIGHTELKPLATDKFREWQQQHSGC